MISNAVNSERCRPRRTGHETRNKKGSKATDGTVFSVPAPLSFDIEKQRLS
jgi:hypothetical protein